jgi:hypothetical protein
VVAQIDLYEIRHLCPGKSAPEITCKDVDGHPFRLSDHRGVIRHRFPITPCTKRLDSAIDALVLAAEEAAP